MQVELKGNKKGMRLKNIFEYSYCGKLVTLVAIENKEKTYVRK